MHSKTRYAFHMKSPERSSAPEHGETAEQAETIKKLKDEVERLKKEAFTDELTGAYNRRGFKETFPNQRAREKHSMAILLADIDHFRDVNNALGHAEGDRVLKAVSERLHAGRRPHDIVTRWGGEEFLIAFSGAEAQDIVNALYERKDPAEPEKKRRAKINIPVTLKDREEPFMITLSGGVTTLRPDEEVETAIARADETLYRAKNSGRDRIESADAIPEEIAAAGADRTEKASEK